MSNANASVGSTQQPRRLFLSYGHDSSIALARQLKIDLEAAGFHVWFDEERLMTGKDWEAYIEDGLDWVASSSGAGFFLLLMTPYSVRRPDGFCLNELARALSRGIPVYPLMVVSCEPPLSIARLQWLDMQDCLPSDERPEKYRQALSRLLKALEFGQVEPTGKWAWFRKQFAPISFEAEMKPHLAHFVGRQWVLDRIQAWLADPKGSSIFWIIGEPGVGKTALATQLCHRWKEVLAFHFCKFGHSMKTDARKCVLSLTYQLATQIPGYASSLEALDLSRITTEENARSIFDALISQPLSQLTASHEHVYCLVIDALDEATFEGRNTIAEVVASEFANVPSWLRLVVTSRPDPDVAFHLQAHDPYVLDAGSAENAADLRRYLDERLRSLTAPPEAVDAAIAHISAQSEGNFLYAKWVADDLHSNRINLSQIGYLSKGLSGVYAAFLSRQFPEARRYDEQCRPALELIVAARRPLRPNLIGSAVGWDRRQLRDFMRSVGTLFPESEEGLRPFHKSLSDWLTNERLSGFYYTASEDGHRALAKAGLRQWAAAPEKLDPYFHAHLPYHLVNASEPVEAAAILRDPQFLQHRCDAGFLFEAIEDYERTQDPVLHAIGRALSLSRAALSSDSSQLPGQFFGRLGRRPEAALQTFLEQLEQRTTFAWLRPRFSPLAGPEIRLQRYWKALPKVFECRMILSQDEQLLAVIGALEEHYFRSADGQIIAPDLARPALGAIDFGWRQKLSGSLWEVLPTNHWAQRAERGAITAVAKWYDRETGWIRTLPVFVSELELRVQDTLVPLEHSSDVTLAIAVTEGGRHLIGGGRSGRIAVWRVEDGHLLHDFQVCRTPIIAIAATRDLQSVFFLTADGFLGISAIQTGHPVEQVLLDTRGESSGLFLAPGGDRVIVVSRNGHVTQWNLETGESIYEGQAPTPVHKVDFSASQDLRFITIEGPGFDYYDGNMLVVHDLEAGKVVYKGESALKDYRWNLALGILDDRAILQTDAISIDRCMYHIDLTTGEVQTGPAPDSIKPLRWFDRKSQLYGRAGFCQLSESGHEVLVWLKGESDRFVSFTADQYILDVAVARDRAVVVALGGFGQLYALDLIRGTSIQKSLPTVLPPWLIFKEKLAQLAAPVAEQLESLAGQREDGFGAFLLASHVSELAVELLTYRKDELAPHQLESLKKLVALWESVEDSFLAAFGDPLKDFVQTEQWAQLRRAAQETLLTFVDVYSKIR
jgi:hypothetical protein